MMLVVPLLLLLFWGFFCSRAGSMHSLALRWVGNRILANDGIVTDSMITELPFDGLTALASTLLLLLLLLVLVLLLLLLLVVVVAAVPMSVILLLLCGFGLATKKRSHKPLKEMPPSN